MLRPARLPPPPRASSCTAGTAAPVQAHAPSPPICLAAQEAVEAGKWVRGPWAGSPEDEQAVLEVRRAPSLAQTCRGINAAGIAQSSFTKTTRRSRLVGCTGWLYGCSQRASTRRPPTPAQETGASLRCIPLVQPTSMARGFSTCLYSGYQATEVALFARAL